jgi:hypothetical protein
MPTVQFDPMMIFMWLKVILAIGLPIATGLWAIWKKKEGVDVKIKESAPLIWGTVQQELRRNGGKLPGGKTPLALALELFEKIVPMTARQRSLAEVALKAYHETMGAPEPGASTK